MLRIASCIDFPALAAEVDRVAPRPASPQGSRPPYPTETMVRILVLKRLYNLSDEQMEYQLLDRHSYQRFCGLVDAARLPDRTTIWHFENRIGVAGAEALFAAVEQQILQHGYVARGGQMRWVKCQPICLSAPSVLLSKPLLTVTTNHMAFRPAHLTPPSKCWRPGGT